MRKKSNGNGRNKNTVAKMKNAFNGLVSRLNIPKRRTNEFAKCT